MTRVERGHRLLDVGCGIGYHLERMKDRHRDLRVFGLEFDSESILFTARRVDGQFVNSDAGSIPFKDNSFDRVISVSVLEHLEDDEKMMREMVRVCKDRGELIISVPSKDGLRSFSRLRNAGHEDPDHPEYHFRIGYSKRELTVMLEKCGVNIRACNYSMIITTEIVMDLVKWVYLRKNRLDNQTNIYQATNSTLFMVYRAGFPIILLMGYLEKMLLGRWLKGHIVNIRGIVRKVD